MDEGEAKVLLGLDANGNGRLVMYGDDSNYPIAYLGENEKTNEMILQTHKYRIHSKYLLCSWKKFFTRCEAYLEN